MSSSNVGTSPFGQMALDSASANPVSSHDWEPLMTGPGRFFGTGAYFGASDRATLLPPPLQPNYLGDYGREYVGYVPPLVRDNSDLFGLTASTYQPPITGELQESLLDGVLARQRKGVAERQIAVVTTAEERYARSPNGSPMAGEPQEEQGATFDIDRQLWDPVETPQVVPSVHARPWQPSVSKAPEDDGATAVQDWRIAEYEARLQNSWARASAAYDAGCRSP